MALPIDKFLEVYNEVREGGPDVVKAHARTNNDGAILPRHQPGVPHNDPWVPTHPANSSGAGLPSAGDPTRGEMSDGSNVVGDSDQGGEVTGPRAAGSIESRLNEMDDDGGRNNDNGGSTGSVTSHGYASGASIEVVGGTSSASSASSVAGNDPVEPDVTPGGRQDLERLITFAGVSFAGRRAVGADWHGNPTALLMSLDGFGMDDVDFEGTGTPNTPTTPTSEDSDEEE